MKKCARTTKVTSVILSCCTMLIILFPVYTQAQEMATRLYTAKDGLPSNYVYGAYADKLGYLWVCSPEGLSRFDGKNFTNYGIDDGLLDTRAWRIFMDSKQRLWVTTTRGAVQFKGNRFINYPMPDSLNGRLVFKIFETREGQIWCLTSKGIYQFEATEWKKIKLFPGLEYSGCVDAIETNDGIYLNCSSAIVLKKPDNTYKIIGNQMPSGFYFSTFLASAGKIYTTTLDGVFEVANQQLVKQPGLLGQLKGDYSCFLDSKKRFWLGQYKLGLQLYDLEDTLHFIQVIKPSIDFLPQAYSEDTQGNIWLGTGNGLLRISEMGFKNFDLSLISKTNVLRNVFQPPTGPVVINDGSLVLKTLENGIFGEQKVHVSGKTPLPNNELIIDNYAFDNKGRYWYFIRGFALAMQDGNNIFEQSKELAHLGDQVFDVLFDKYRKKILVSVRTQKYPCQFNDTTYSVFPVSNNIDIIGNISYLHQCANGMILFSTNKGSIYSIDKKNICRLQLNEFGDYGFISKFYNGPDGDVWIIYAGRGVRHYTWQNDTLVYKDNLTKANGLPSDNEASLCFDDNNNLWVCNNVNVTVFSKNKDSSGKHGYQVVSFFNAEDLKTYGGVDARMMKDNTGNIWLYSRNFLICFDPNKINYSAPTPAIRIEKVELNLRQTNWADYSDSLSGIFQLPYNLKLSHENNTLGIYYNGISSSGTDGVKYSYELEGLDNLWSPPSSNNFVSFVRLPPGKYTFKVKAQLPNTNWSEPAVFSFEIKKAFWQTWWFYMLAAIIFLGCAYILFRYRLQQKVKLLEMRNRISQDLHDEIGASMSGINLLSQIAAEKLEQNKTAEAADYLLKVKNYTQDVIEKLSDMVWIFNPQNDSIEKLLQRLRSFFFTIGISKNIKLTFETDKLNDSINRLTLRQRKAIYLISKEALNNCFKYSDCGNIYYRLGPSGSKWLLQVEDDGKGFTVSEDTSGNGLKNMQARASEIGAKLNIQSQPGNGTIITMEF